MASSEQSHIRFLSAFSRFPGPFTLPVLMLLFLVGSPAASGQKYKVIYEFSGTPDGAAPLSTLTMDGSGNLYGTTARGGDGGLCHGDGCGSVFKLTRRNSKWVSIQLYGFAGDSDGAFPQGRVLRGPSNSLYGVTVQGGATGCDDNCGTIFQLSPPASLRGSWTEIQLHQFVGGADGYFPGPGDLVFDGALNLYGTTFGGGANNQGTVYKLNYGNGKWTEGVIYSFAAGADGRNPYAGVTFDRAGNLYGTTSLGNITDNGTVFQLTPSAPGWTEKVIYSFQNGSDGSFPVGGLIADQSGNLYGTTAAGGSASGGGGTVFELSPNSDGTWTFHLLYSLPGNFGAGPMSNLVMDSKGALYGTTQGDGTHSWGSVFKLTPSSSGPWNYTSVHDFVGGEDGYFPYGSVILDAAGNIFGTAAQGGNNGCQGNGCGVVFEIRP